MGAANLARLLHCSSAHARACLSVPLTLSRPLPRLLWFAFTGPARRSSQTIGAHLAPFVSNVVSPLRRKQLEPRLAAYTRIDPN